MHREQEQRHAHVHTHAHAPPPPPPDTHAAGAKGEITENSILVPPLPLQDHALCYATLGTVLASAIATVSVPGRIYSFKEKSHAHTKQSPPPTGPRPAHTQTDVHTHTPGHHTQHTVTLRTG